MEEIDTEAATAAHTKVPRATLRNWRSLRKGPPFLKIGKHVRYRKADVDAWLDGQRVEPGS